jgi:ubiquinone/menaquinone biosynthesis C-methylase UbiE
MTSLFDPLAEVYDASRPDYPDALFESLSALTQPLDGARIVDVGAGTGISTRALRARGATVLPVDHGAVMLARLQARDPQFPTAVQADAHHLPVKAGWADLVTYAQAWHWTDPPRATAEAARVLRPGGALAVWWNFAQIDDAEFLRLQLSRLWRYGVDPSSHHFRPFSQEFQDLGWSVEHTTCRWIRSVPLDEYLLYLRSKSYIAALEPELLEDFIAEERASLRQAFPGGIIQEPFATELYVTRPPL